MSEPEMDEPIQKSPQLGLGVDSDEAKYISSLSTILVATIQEAKDRIAQIEYIFCRQIYPNFQKRPKTVQRIYSDARKAAEEAWNEKEKQLLCQIESLKLEKLQALAQIGSLNLDKKKQLGELEESTNLLRQKLRSQEDEIYSLRTDLKKKNEEADEGMELHRKLAQVVQTKTSEVIDKDKKLKDYEENANKLLVEAKGLETKVDLLREELREKAENFSRERVVTANLLKKVESLSSEITDKERVVNEIRDENVIQATKLEAYAASVSRLEGILKEKMSEVDDRKKLQGQLQHKLDQNEAESLRDKQQLVEREKEKKILAEKLRSLEEENANLRFKIKNEIGKVGKESDYYEDLRKENELKSTQLAKEKKKLRDAADSYKRLKSQYLFLLSKLGLTAENTTSKKDEDKNDSLRHHKDPTTSPAIGNKISISPETSWGPENVRDFSILKSNREEENVIRMIQASGRHSPFSAKKSLPVCGTKRPASSWRETRTRQIKDALDPHDSFLDTPLGNFKLDLNKTMDEDHQDQHATVPKDPQPDDSDDETQDLGLGTSPQKQQIQAVGANERPYKYVEPLRKKSERERLKGVECKQCKKFYDAVLPGDGRKDNGGNKKTFRCEHHEGVSRHRYKYAPPMTPEGFWNIGFESEM